MNRLDTSAPIESTKENSSGGWSYICLPLIERYDREVGFIGSKILTFDTGVRLSQALPSEADHNC